MPAKIDEISINNELLDKRIKLLNEHKILIVNLYATNMYSQRDLAKLFNVSRRTIVFTIYPDRRIKNYENRVNSGGSKQYYVKDIHTKQMKIHRTYKTKLHKEGKI